MSRLSYPKNAESMWMAQLFLTWARGEVSFLVRNHLSFHWNLTMPWG